MQQLQELDRVIALFVPIVIGETIADGGDRLFIKVAVSCIGENPVDLTIREEQLGRDLDEEVVCAALDRSRSCCHRPSKRTPRPSALRPSAPSVLR